MMKLLSNALSPYGRKVKLTIAVKSLGSQIEMVIVDTNPGTNVEINSANPLGENSLACARRQEAHLRQQRNLRVSR